MARINLNISDENEAWLREQNRKKGDMSRNINRLLDDVRVHLAEKQDERDRTKSVSVAKKSGSF